MVAKKRTVFRNNINPGTREIDPSDIISEILDSKEYTEIVGSIETLLEELILGYFEDIELEEYECSEIVEEVRDGVLQELKGDLE